MAPDRTLTLPRPVEQRLSELLAGLRAALGDDLAAVLVHGSAARGEYREGESDVDLLVVLRSDPPDKLAAIGPALKLARYAARIEAMILRADEIPRAADCFPLLYDEIASSGVVIAGVSPFAGVAVERQHLRLRIEQELREARIRLRRVIADSTGDDAALGRAIERKAKQVRGALRALLGLRGEDGGDSLGATLEAAGRAYDVDVAPLRRAREQPGPARDALTRLLEGALADVDAREDPPEARR